MAEVSLLLCYTIIYYVVLMCLVDLHVDFNFIIVLWMSLIFDIAIAVRHQSTQTTG